jgi:hypothetical protein
MRIQAAPDTGQTSKSQKVVFFHEEHILSTVGNWSETINTKAKSLFERQKTRFICKFW